MAISLASLRRGGDARPPRILVYGVAGVGKTQFAADAPDPVFLQTEDGLGQIEASTFGLLRSFDQVMEALGCLYTEEHAFRTRGAGQPRLAGAAGLAAHRAGARPDGHREPSATARATSPRSTSGGPSSTASMRCATSAAWA